MKRTPARLWDFPSAAILFLVLLIASARLYITHWAPGLGTAIILVSGGVALGLALGISQFNRGMVFWLLFGDSTAIVFLVLGWILYNGVAWWERLADMGDRLAYSFGLLLTGQKVEDTLLFVVFMALVFWVTGLTAGFALTRFGNFTGAVLPAGVIWVIIQTYDPGNRISDAFLAVFLFLCLLLLGRLAQIQKWLFWKEQRVTVLSESRTHLNITLVVVPIVLVVLVWLVPTSTKSFSNLKATWDKLNRPFQHVQENLGHAVAGIQGSQSIIQTVKFYGDVLPLGSQAATGKGVYLRIQAPSVNNPERYYWRVRSYDTFLHDQWIDENFSTTPFDPGQTPLSLADSEGLSGEFTFSVSAVNLAVLVTPARPVWVSTPSELFFLPVPQGEMGPGPIPARSAYFSRAAVCRSGQFIRTNHPPTTQCRRGLSCVGHCSLPAIAR